MVKLKVEKMSCGHCANAVTAAATKVSGVESAKVDLESGEIAVSGTAVPLPDEVVSAEGHESS